MKKHPPLPVCGETTEPADDPTAFDGFVITCSLDHGHAGRHACVPGGQALSDDYMGWGVLWSEQYYEKVKADERFSQCTSTGGKWECHCSWVDQDHRDMHRCRCGRKWHPRSRRGFIGRLRLVRDYLSPYCRKVRRLIPRSRPARPQPIGD